MEDLYGHRISYLRVSITDRCNERCRYCMPDEVQQWMPRNDLLSYEEMLRVITVSASMGVKKVRVTGGEPLTRRDAIPFLRRVGGIEGIDEVCLSTNGTLLAQPDTEMAGRTVAEALVEAGVSTVNVSLDTLDPLAYKAATGRDFLQRAIDGIDAARAAGMKSIRINSVLMKNCSEGQLSALLKFCAERDLLLRFIELMPVSSEEVLSDDNFLPVSLAKRILELSTGPLDPLPEFRTNGPASYFSVPGTEQKVGFIGAMTNFHFCETCNKLRLTSDGKLRPCLGSHLEFDLRDALRAECSDEELKRLILDVVAKKPKEHEFRDNYRPDRRMVAIGG